MKPLKTKVPPIAAVLISLILLMAVPAAAEWYTRTWEDPKTGGQVEGAEVLDAKGNHLMFWRYRGEVWGIFRLAKDSDDTIGKNLPIYRIDNFDPVNLNGLTRPETSNLYRKGDKYTMWRLSAGQTPLAGDENIVHFLNGYSVIFRFDTPAGERKEVRFTLSGSKRNMTQALDVK